MPRKNIKGRRLYCILDLDLPYLKKSPAYIAKNLIAGGADIIQLRTKSCPAKNFIKIGAEIGYLTRKSKVVFIINNRVDIAVAVEADGVHLGQEDLPVEDARKILGKDKIIGLSTHSLTQAIAAQNYDIDYISVGPIFKSPTKPELTPIGIETLKKIVRISNLPVVAIGGINIKNLETVFNCGADNIAIISAILSSDNIRENTRGFKTKINLFFNRKVF